MRLVVEQIEGRIATLDRPTEPRAAVAQVLHELLPLDDELFDGLAVHTALRPDLMPPEQIVAVVRLHLDALDNEADPAQPTASA